MSLDPTIPINLPGIGNRPDGQIAYYGCCRCGRHHFEGTRWFRDHLPWQSKHGVQSMSRAEYARQVAGGN